MFLLLFKSVSKNGQLMHLCVPLKGYCIKLEESSYKVSIINLHVQPIQPLKLKIHIGDSPICVISHSAALIVCVCVFFNLFLVWYF